VRYDTFDSTTRWRPSLLAGKSGYDVVVPDRLLLERQIKAGVFQSSTEQAAGTSPMSGRKIGAAAGDPRSRQPVRGQLYVGTTGLGYNVKKVREI